MRFLLPLLSTLLFALPSVSHGLSNSSAYLNLGFDRGGLAFGGEFEYARDRIYGMGAFARIYSKDEDRGANGVFAFGGFVRPHFQRGPWDLYVSPGVAVLFIDGVGFDETTIGPMLNIGLLYLVTNSMSVGLENTQMYSWFGKESKGPVTNDLQFKLRYQF